MVTVLSNVFHSFGALGDSEKFILLLHIIFTLHLLKNYCQLSTCEQFFNMSEKRLSKFSVDASKMLTKLCACYLDNERAISYKHFF